jgi:ornithine--oxo-acid transaminase
MAGSVSDPFYDVDDSSDSSGRAAGLATLEVMESEKLIENAASKGERLSAFRNMAERHELLKTVRGKGLMTDRIRRSQLVKLKASWSLLETVSSGLFCQLIVIPLLKEHRILTYNSRPRRLRRQPW